MSKNETQHIAVNVIDLNIEIEALDRLSRSLYAMIEKWEDSDPVPVEGIAWLTTRFNEINTRIAELLTLKQSLGLTL